MFRSFCVGALVGFVFGSSKKGQHVWKNLDGMMTELTSSDAMKSLDETRNELSEFACSTVSKMTSKFTDNQEQQNNKERSASHSDASQDNHSQESFEPEQKSEPVANEEKKSSGESAPLDADKAQELADKLGAKPSTPEDENLAAFSHHDDELKSA